MNLTSKYDVQAILNTIDIVYANQSKPNQKSYLKVTSTSSGQIQFEAVERYIGTWGIWSWDFPRWLAKKIYLFCKDQSLQQNHIITELTSLILDINNEKQLFERNDAVKTLTKINEIFKKNSSTEIKGFNTAIASLTDRENKYNNLSLTKDTDLQNRNEIITTKFNKSLQTTDKKLECKNLAKKVENITQPLTELNKPETLLQQKPGMEIINEKIENAINEIEKLNFSLKTKIELLDNFGFDELFYLFNKDDINIENEEDLKTYIINLCQRRNSGEGKPLSEIEKLKIFDLIRIENINISLHFSRGINLNMYDATKNLYTSWGRECGISKDALDNSFASKKAFHGTLHERYQAYRLARPLVKTVHAVGADVISINGFKLILHSADGLKKIYETETSFIMARGWYKEDRNPKADGYWIQLYVPEIVNTRCEEVNITSSEDAFQKTIRCKLREGMSDATFLGEEIQNETEWKIQIPGKIKCNTYPNIHRQRPHRRSLPV